MWRCRYTGEVAALTSLPSVLLSLLSVSACSAVMPARSRRSEAQASSGVELTASEADEVGRDGGIQAPYALLSRRLQRRVTAAFTRLALMRCSQRLRCSCT